VDREHAQRALDRYERSEPRVPSLQLQARQTVGDGARARAPVSLEVHPEKPEVGEALGHLKGELAALEPVRDPWEDLIADEAPDGVPDRPLLVGEKQVDVEEVERIGSAAHDGPLA